MNKLFAKIAALALGAAMVVGVGVSVGSKSVKSAEATTEGYTSIYKLNTATCGNTNSNAYASVGTIDDVTDNETTLSWALRGNGQQHPWRMGGKNLSGESRECYTTTALNSNVDRIEITFGTATDVTVHSFTVSVHNSAEDAEDGSNPVSTFSPTFSESSMVGVDFGSSYNGKYYRFVLNVTITKKDNKNKYVNCYVQLSSIEFLQQSSLTQLATPTLSYSNNEVSWQPVPNASSYKVKIDDGEFETGTSPVATASLSSSAAHVIQVKAIGDGQSYSDSDPASITVAKLAHAGTSADPYTVADARAAIDDTTGTITLTSKYATGIVSYGSPQLYSSKYLTYYISDDGTRTNELEAYNGLNNGGAAFTSKDDVQVGGTAVVYGTLKKFNSTYEFDADNELYSYTAPVVTTYSVTYSANGADSGSVPTDSTAYSANAKVTVAGNTGNLVKSGYVFTGWKVSGDDTLYNENDSYTITDDVTFVAQWATAYTVTYSAGANGDGTFSHANQPAGTYVLLPFASLSGISADSGYTFKSYTVDGVERDPGYEITLSSAKTVTVNFEEGSNETTISTTVQAYASAHSWANESQYTTMNLDSYITVEVDGGGNSGKYYTNGYDWRLYSSESAKLIISCPEGTTLMSATITFSSSDSPTIQYNSASITSGTAVTLVGNLAEFSVTAGKAHITGISVTYIASGPAPTIYTVSYAANGGSGSMASTIGTDPEVASNEFTAPSGKMFACWNTAADGTGISYFPGDIVHEDLSLNAIWINEVASNVTMAPKTSASAATVNGITGVKCGTGSAAGAMTMTLKVANITKIKFYLAGWNNDSNHTINITVSSGSVSPTSITSVSDSGMNSNTPFTLAGDPADFKFELTLTNVPKDGIITLTAGTAKNNRFVVWGATDLYAEYFASEFNSNVVCVAAGTSEPTYQKNYSWMGFKALFNSLDSEEQGRLHDANALEGGTSIERAMAKYDYIVGKYNKAQGKTSQYNDFINRDPSPIGSSGRIVLGSLGLVEGNPTAIIIIVSVIGVSALGGFFFLRKRKEI